MTDAHTPGNDPALKELYHLEEEGQSVLIDPVTRKILLRKELEYYNPRVFVWLKEHPSPYIPSIENICEKDGHLIVEEEFIQGRTLAEMMAEGNIDSQTKKQIVLSVMDGLSYLHHADPPIIHRDLKASNILISTDGMVKIIDYDAAKLYTPSEARDTVLIGTEGSAAPEQYGFGSSDQRTDIYALGILLKQLYTEDPGIREIAAKASMLDPRDRYQTVEEMRQAFVKGGRRSPIPEPYRKYIPPGFRSGKLWKMLVAVIGYILIFYLTFTFETKDGRTGEMITGTRLTVYKLVVFGLLMSELDLFTGWTKLREKMPLVQHPQKRMRILGYVISAVLLFAFWIVILGVLGG